LDFDRKYSLITNGGGIPKPNGITNVDNEAVEFARITVPVGSNDKYNI
jgi:hypothetical protein